MRTRAVVDLGQVARNLRILSAAARERYARYRGAVPMVKCNAYGHGLAEVGRRLERAPETLALGVATLEEGIALRQAGVRKPIWVFSDCGPWTDAVAGAVGRHALTPVVHRLEDLKAILEPRHRRAVGTRGFHLKFNTGMNRLGLAVSEVEDARRLCARAGLSPSGLCSHLAAAEEPGSRVTRSQTEALRGAVTAFALGDSAYIHCANSDAIVQEPALGLGRFCDVVRPGIGLYGYGEGARLAGVRPTLRWEAKVVAARRLTRGANVGYNATFRAKGPLDQSILAVGYGDGFLRALSNKQILVGTGGGRLREAAVVGRVSMDLVALNLRSNPGEWVTLLGNGGRQGTRLAEAAGTIVYELLTAISARVPRIYE